MQQFLDWLESENLLRIAKNNFVHFKKPFRDCLDAKNEDILIICDSGYPGKRIAPLMAVSYYYAAKKMSLNARLLAENMNSGGELGSEKIVEALKNLKEGSSIILCLSNRLGAMKGLGKSYRKFANMNKHRFISTPGLGSLATKYYTHFVKSLNVDYRKLHMEAKRIKDILDWGKEIRVVTKKGTDLTFSIRGRNAVVNDGDYTRSGTGGNLPAGEVYIAPLKQSVNGIVVIDGTLRHQWGAMVVDKPVTITVDQGQIYDIKGGPEATYLRKSFEYANTKSKFSWGINYVGEFGIGINPKASLLGATIVDEKVLGTAHVAFGSNYWFGGTNYAIMHLDQVFKDPKIYVDDELLKIQN